MYCLCLHSCTAPNVQKSIHTHASTAHAGIYRIEGRFDFLCRHLFLNLQRDALLQMSGHDEIHGAVANTVAVAAIVVGDALETHLDDAKNGCAVLH